MVWVRMFVRGRVGMNWVSCALVRKIRWAGGGKIEGERRGKGRVRVEAGADTFVLER